MKYLSMLVSKGQFTRREEKPEVHRKDHLAFHIIYIVGNVKEQNESTDR